MLKNILNNKSLSLCGSREQGTFENCAVFFGVPSYDSVDSTPTYVHDEINNKGKRLQEKIVLRKVS